MPKHHSPTRKQEALDLLDFHKNNVPIVRQITGIPAPTLYRWRRELLSQNPDYMRGKNVASIDNHLSINCPPNDSQAHTDSGAEITGTSNESPTTPENGLYKYVSSPRDPESRARDLEYQETYRGGIPGKSYPYPVEDDEPETEFEELKEIRAIMMNHARYLAVNLRPDEPDINLRSLALSRILDNVHQLDLKLPALDPEHIFRIEYIDNGMVYDMPAWADESLKYKNKIAELERQLEEALNARGTA